MVCYHFLLSLSNKEKGHDRVRFANREIENCTLWIFGMSGIHLFQLFYRFWFIQISKFWDFYTSFGFSIWFSVAAVLCISVTFGLFSRISSTSRKWSRIIIYLPYVAFVSQQTVLPSFVMALPSNWQDYLYQFKIYVGFLWQTNIPKGITALCQPAGRLLEVVSLPSSF